MEVLLAPPRAEEAMWGKAIFTRAVLRAFRKKDREAMVCVGVGVGRVGGGETWLATASLVMTEPG